jgi:hypothetical protein
MGGLARDERCGRSASGWGITGRWRRRPLRRCADHEDSAAIDGRGRHVSIIVTGGQRNDGAMLASVLAENGGERFKGANVLADRLRRWFPCLPTVAAAPCT